MEVYDTFSDLEIGNNDFDLYETTDWMIEICSRINYDPHNLKHEMIQNFEKWWNPNWKRLFTAPRMRQKSAEWYNTRKGKIRGSDLQFVFSLAKSYQSFDPDKRKQLCWQTLKQLKQGVFETETNEMMAHGNKYESLAAEIATTHLNDLSFEFGSVDHPTESFLACSPDIILWKRETMVEIKCPWGRNIFSKLNVDDFQQMEKLVIELEYSNFEKKKYEIITNLPIQLSGLLDKMSDYWHQIQLQLSVFDFPTDHAIFQQLSVPPNPYFSNPPTSVFTKVKRDPNWLSSNLDVLRDCYRYVKDVRE